MKRSCWWPLCDSRWLVSVTYLKNMQLLRPTQQETWRICNYLFSILKVCICQYLCTINFSHHQNADQVKNTWTEQIFYFRYIVTLQYIYICHVWYKLQSDNSYACLRDNNNVCIFFKENKTHAHTLDGWCYIWEQNTGHHT